MVLNRQKNYQKSEIKMAPASDQHEIVIEGQALELCKQRNGPSEMALACTHKSRDDTCSCLVMHGPETL